MNQENTLRMALTALESCSGAPHWDSLQPTVTAIKKALVALAQTSSDKDLTQQDFDRDCDAPPEPWSAIWVAWNSEDGFTFWATEKQAALWSAADSNEWPVQYAMQKAQPAVPPTLWTEAQHARAYINSPELHKDVKSFAAFKRVAKDIAAMYGITAAPEKGGAA
jgi:hypothetical protein